LYITGDFCWGDEVIKLADDEGAAIVFVGVFGIVEVESSFKESLA